jgi:hypothetical protein
MEILNVGAGQTNQEHEAAEEQRRAELLSDSKNAANYFFIAAGLAALSTGLLPVRVNILVNVGIVDLLSLYGGSLGRLLPVVVSAVASLWLLVLLVLGFAGRAQHRWAFWVGLVLYAADMLALMLTFSLWAFSVHAFFVFRWYQGQVALQEIKESATTIQ